MKYLTYVKTDQHWTALEENVSIKTLHTLIWVIPESNFVF